MKANLLCDNENRDIIKEVLKSKGVDFQEDADIVFIERDRPLPAKDCIYIVFNPNDINSILRFFSNSIGKSDKIEDKKRILAKKGEKYELIPYEKIAFFEADGNNVFGKTTSNEEFRVKEKLYELEESLDSKVFIRTSKSYIVNILNVQEIVPWFGGKIMLKFASTKRELEVSRSYVKNFKNFLGL